MGCALTKRRKLEKKAPPPSSVVEIFSPIIVPPTPSDSLASQLPSPPTQEEVEEVEEEKLEVARVVILDESEKNWCLKQLEEWRNGLERDAALPSPLVASPAQPPQDLAFPSFGPLLASPPIAVPQIEFFDAAGDSLKPLEDKQAFMERMKKEKERRKRISMNFVTDETTYEVPTRMPTISFSNYNSCSL